MSNLLPQFADRLRTLRESRGLTQDEVAESINYSKRAYRSWETGEREAKIDALCKLADFYGVSCDYLLGKIDEKDHDIQFIHDYLRLSEEAIAKLEIYCQFNLFLNRVLENEAFYNAAGDIHNAFLQLAQLGKALGENNHEEIWKISEKLQAVEYQFSKKMSSIFVASIPHYDDITRKAEEYKLRHPKFGFMRSQEENETTFQKIKRFRKTLSEAKE